MRLTNKVVLLAGAGPRMGRATATLFAQEGAKVAVNARSEDHLEETVSGIETLGGEAIAIPGDVSSKAEAERVVGEAHGKFGRIDVLYCGAGGFFEPTREYSDIDEQYWGTVLKNTMDSLYNVTQAVAPIMAEQGGGAIVAVTASFSVRQEANPAYGAAKSGVIGLAQSLARELYPQNIRVNTIAAGLFRGKIGEGPIAPAPAVLARTGYPQDIAYAALYLASDESWYVTGQVLAVDGGVDVGTRLLWQFER